MKKNKKYFKGYKYLQLINNNSLINLNISNKGRVFVNDLGLKNIFQDMFPSYSNNNLIASLYLLIIYVLYNNDDNDTLYFHNFMNKLKNAYYYDSHSLVIYQIVINKIYTMNTIMYGDSKITHDNVILPFTDYNEFKTIILDTNNKYNEECYRGEKLDDKI